MGIEGFNSIALFVSATASARKKTINKLKFIDFHNRRILNNKIIKKNNKEREKKDTSKVSKFDVGLSAVNIQVSVIRANLDGFRVEFGCKLKVIVDEGFFGFRFQIGSH